jgi:hypothetical protein
VAPAGSEATGAVAQPAESEIATHAAVTVRIRVVVVGRCVVNVSVWSVLSVLSAGLVSPGCWWFYLMASSDLTMLSIVATSTFAAPGSPSRLA